MNLATVNAQFFIIICPLSQRKADVKLAKVNERARERERETTSCFLRDSSMSSLYSAKQLAPFIFSLLFSPATCESKRETQFNRGKETTERISESERVILRFLAHGAQSTASLTSVSGVEATAISRQYNSPVARKRQVEAAQQLRKRKSERKRRTVKRKRE